MREASCFQGEHCADPDSIFYADILVGSRAVLLHDFTIQIMVGILLMLMQYTTQVYCIPHFLEITNHCKTMDQTS